MEKVRLFCISVLTLRTLMSIFIFSLLFYTVATAPLLRSVYAEIPLATKKQLIGTYHRLPLSFEVNNGQVNPQVNFMARGSGYTLFLTQTDAVLSLHSATIPENKTVLRMQLIDANSKSNITGLEELPGKVNYFISNSKKWRTNIPTFGKVLYEDVYPGVDMAYYGNQQKLEYDFIVSSGADPAKIQLSFKGADNAELDDRGNLILKVNGGEVVYVPR